MNKESAMAIDLMEKWKNKEGTCLMYGSVEEIFDPEEKKSADGYTAITPEFEGGIIVEDVTDTTLTVIVLTSVLADHSVKNKFLKDVINCGYIDKSSRDINVARNGRLIPHTEIVLKKIENMKLMSVTREGNSITCNFDAE
jgi:hypothetical protein